MTHTSLWCSTRDDVESSVIRGWDSAVTSSVQELVAELVTFLQVIFCSFFNVHSPGNEKNELFKMVSFWLQIPRFVLFPGRLD